MPNTGLIQCEADATGFDSPNAGAGTGNHLPIGYFGGKHYKSIVRFPEPSGWDAWTAVTKATLSFAISDHTHVNARNSTINVSRQAISVAQWTKAEGSSACEFLTTGNTTLYSDMGGTGSDMVSFSSGSADNAPKSVDVTAALRYYWSNSAKPVFIFDAASSADYTELWSRDKTGGYDITLSIDYEVASPPNPPTLTGPTAGQVVVPTKPTFAWTHSDPQGDPQSQANVQLYDAGGTAIGAPVNVAGSTASLTWPTDLTRGLTYQFAVQTADSISGFGLYSAKRSFSIKAAPVVTIDPVRYMVFSNGAPRLLVKWSTDQPQSDYQVTATPPTYDGLLQSGGIQQWTLDGLALVSGTSVTVTVTVHTPDGIAGSASRSFMPRYGLTTHHKDLGSAPTAWGQPVIGQAVPTDATLKMQYGSDPTSATAPGSWKDTISQVPLARHLFWRAWFIPSATAGPTLDSVNIPTKTGVLSLDKWGTTKDVEGLVAPWKINDLEYVYGTRSIMADITGPGESLCYSFKVRVKQDSFYLLSGLMKSVGNSGACIQLRDAAGLLKGGGAFEFPNPSDMSTDILTGDKDWNVAGTVYDLNRYKTPVWKADGTKDVWVVLRVNGVAGSQAYFDAVKLEESTVATPWSPGSVGATVIDAGGVQVDGSKGGVFRVRGTAAGARDVVEGGTSGLLFGTDTELSSPSTGVLSIGGVPIGGVMPPGMITAFGGAAAPTGWLLCQGQSLLRTDYPALFTAIGTAFGSVDGTHFTLPDMRGRFPLGADGGHALATTGGSIDHTHTYAQTVHHDHTNTFANSLGTGTPNPLNSTAAGGSAGRWSAATGNAIVVGGVSTGTTASNNPPYAALNYIIKT